MEKKLFAELAEYSPETAEAVFAMLMEFAGITSFTVEEGHMKRWYAKGNRVSLSMSEHDLATVVFRQGPSVSFEEDARPDPVIPNA